MTDIWTYLKETKKPVVMYGMGNGADKMLSVLSEASVEVQDFFASDGFVRGHSFHGKRVLSYSEIKEKYKGECIVLMSFASSREDVLENVRRISSECELYLPDVPVRGDGLFDAAFARAHREELEKVRALLADEESRHIYDNIIKYKITADISYLFSAESDTSESMDILGAARFEVAADLGAYNGDTARELIEFAPDIRKIIALEPDRRSFRKLSEYAKNESRCEILPVNAVAWCEDTSLSFEDAGNRNSGVNADAKKTITVNAVKLDTLTANEERLDYIKYDVEGSEKEALLGSTEAIKRFSPAILLSLYHRNEDIFSLPLLLLSIDKDYRLYLRRKRGIPAWDINLLAVKR